MEGVRTGRRGSGGPRVEYWGLFQSSSGVSAVHRMQWKGVVDVKGK